jgi:protein translocase SecG subunit
MAVFFIFVLTTFLLALCMITILFILMQRPSEESGIGATLGGNAVTSILGGEGVNTLARITKYCVAIFFSVSFILSLIYMALERDNRPQNLFQKKEVLATVNTEANGELPSSYPETSPVDSQQRSAVPEKTAPLEGVAPLEKTAPGEGSASLEKTISENIEDVNIFTDDNGYTF